mgnify:CR=1 FL=1
MKSLISDTNGLYLDCTFGRGGHTKKILDKLSSEGQLISFDLDDDAMKVAKNIDNKNFKFIKTNFNMQKSTIIMMSKAFMGNDFIKKAYEEAIKEKYNFFSYGDSMLII